MFKRVLIALVVLALPGLAWAEGFTNTDVDVTAVSQTLVFVERDSEKAPYIAGSILVRAHADAAQNLYFWVFTDAQYRGGDIGDTCGGAINNTACVRPATIADRMLLAGTSMRLVHDPEHETGSGYVAISLVCDAGGTSSDAIVDAQ